MDLIREKLLFLITTPLYAFFIGAEILFSYFHNRSYYSAKGTLINVWLSGLNFMLDMILRGFCLYFLTLFFEFRTIDIQTPWVYWLVLFFAEDFLYYWLHRVDHYCRLFWAVHVTHHSSQEFNLTVGFRSSVFQPLYRFVWFIPLAIMGFKAEDIMLMYGITQLYGILIHTRYIGKLGPLEWILATPSHHRVHHGTNVDYLDRNMGMTLIIWDRLFGTFAEEDEPVKYGLTKNLENPHHPIKAIFHEWTDMFRDLKKAPDLQSKLMYIFGPPGWSHDGSRKTSDQLREEKMANDADTEVTVTGEELALEKS
ncbi:MAG TPA: sterol desaturase family protein [Bacteroidia bacterium]|nr:sterol desaturase family protein [Bacteroidia bacterium]